MNTTATVAGKPVELSEETFEARIGQGVVLVDWWAPWCAPCRAFAPTFEKAASKHPEVTFAKVNTEDQPGLARAFAIRAIPTLMVFKDGVLIFAQPGMVPAEALDDLVAQARELDMDVVRAEIARQEAEQAQQKAG